MLANIIIMMRMDTFMVGERAKKYREVEDACLLGG